MFSRATSVALALALTVAPCAGQQFWATPRDWESGIWTNGGIPDTNSKVTFPQCFAKVTAGQPDSPSGVTLGQVVKIGWFTLPSAGGKITFRTGGALTFSDRDKATLKPLAASCKQEAAAVAPVSDAAAAEDAEALEDCLALGGQCIKHKAEVAHNEARQAYQTCAAAGREDALARCAKEKAEYDFRAADKDFKVCNAGGVGKGKAHATAAAKAQACEPKRKDAAAKRNAAASASNDAGAAGDDDSDNTGVLIAVLVAACVVIAVVVAVALVVLKKHAAKSPVDSQPQGMQSFENPMYDSQPVAQAPSPTYAEPPQGVVFEDPPDAGAGGTSGYMDVSANAGGNAASGYMDVGPGGGGAEYLDVKPDDDDENDDI